jgi:hypothetical protein
MPGKTINFAARGEYWSAIELHWPEVMTSLRLDVFPVYRACLKANAPGIALQALAGLSDSFKRGAVEINQLEVALRAWAEGHGFQDDWLQDVAVQSMDNWARGGPTSKWTYLPEELDAPRLQINFGHWIPAYTKWTEFKRLTDQHYRRELALYRAKVRTLWGEGHPKLSQSAVWTVLWQCGKSPEAIQINHRRTAGKNVSLANIQLRVHAFADSAGLSLRASKAGPRGRI